MIQPLFNMPLLLAEGNERVLVAADLHLGLEHELLLCGISIPSQTEQILSRLTGSIEDIGPDRLMLLGDVKLSVPGTSWQERRELPEFLRRLSELVRVEIVPGNHDVSLADMLPSGVRLWPPSGTVLDGVGYFHGHTWPGRDLLDAGLLVSGHLHPVLRLRDPLGCKLTMQVWTRSPLSVGEIMRHYGLSSGPELIIMPAFNCLCGGLPLNEPCEDQRGPLLSIADLALMRVYLLDGTDLGLLSSIGAGSADQ